MATLTGIVNWISDGVGSIRALASSLHIPAPNGTDYAIIQRDNSGITSLDDSDGNLNIQFLHCSSFKVFSNMTSANASFEMLLDDATHTCTWSFGTANTLEFEFGGVAATYGFTADNSNVEYFGTITNQPVKIGTNLGGGAPTAQITLDTGGNLTGIANIVVSGNSGATFTFTSVQSSPSLIPAVPPVQVYGNPDGNYLGDPQAWALVNVGGIDYKMPLYQ